MKIITMAISAIAVMAAGQAAARDDGAGMRLAETVRTLASDQFEGRAPGTAGEDRTVGYLIGRFQALGLEPGGADGGWTQAVPLLHTRLGVATGLVVETSAGRTPWRVNTDVYVSTLQTKERAVVSRAPMVFVGYGVTAPERQWDDYKGLDLSGKVAVFLVNDPDFAAQDNEPVAGKFGGRAMTYYGRWVYKYEEASRRGAIAALIIHETEAAGYGWNVVQSPNGENFDIVRPAGQMTSLALQGWISAGAARRLFADAGLDLAALRKAARSANFAPVVMNGTTFSASFPVQQERIQSQNVLAKISGRTHPDETIMYGAHWDAYGEGPADENGKIYRAGANDDALGIAGLMEIARTFKVGPAPERTVLFAAWAAEERGLLGSETYANDPLYPLEKTVANLTIDILQTAGLAHDVILIGKGQSSLENDLARVAARQGRVVTPEGLPERGLFFRADHFSLAKRGVPVLLMMGFAGASDMVEGGRSAGQQWIDDYTGNCYHAACDAWSADWNLAGAVQDINVMYAIGRDLAFSNRWPQLKATSEFSKIRNQTTAARQ